MIYLTEEDLDYIAVGAAILGAGGGGDPYVGKLMAKQAIKKHGKVRLITADEVPDDEIVIPSAMMGAPSVMLEKLPNGNEPENAFRSLEKYLGKKAYAVIPIEAGGLNSTIPIYTAACLGLPLVDADGMGRAFPELPMTTFSVGGISATPMVVCDEKGNKMVIETVTNAWAETLARTATIAMGLSSMIAIYCMNGSQLKKFSVKGTISFAKAIGKRLIEANKEKTDPIEGLLEVTKGFNLFEGKITDVQRDLTTGFVRGKVLMEGIESCKGSNFQLDFQNENLAGTIDGIPVALTPDLITVLDKEKGFPITTENLKYGQRVVVLGIPCDSFWRTEAGLAQVGPRYFKYDYDYTPIEKLAAGRK
ncbi:MAG: DUF917 domain-containing protein [Spirochaetales bacterium]|nr:DUF917 domain-containing protein [Spirochaetales bacterium]